MKILWVVYWDPDTKSYPSIRVQMIILTSLLNLTDVLSLAVNPLLGGLWQTSYVFPSQVGFYMIHPRRRRSRTRCRLRKKMTTPVLYLKAEEAPVTGLSDVT